MEGGGGTHKTARHTQRGVGMVGEEGEMMVWRGRERGERGIVDTHNRKAGSDHIAWPQPLVPLYRGVR